MRSRVHSSRAELLEVMTGGLVDSALWSPWGADAPERLAGSSIAGEARVDCRDRVGRLFDGHTVTVTGGVLTIIGAQGKFAAHCYNAFADGDETGFNCGPSCPCKADLAPPLLVAVSPESGGFVNTSPVEARVTLSEPGGTLAIVGESGVIDLAGARSGTVSVPLGAADGRYVRWLRVTDVAGNAAVEEVEWVLDRAAPTVTFTPPSGGCLGSASPAVTGLGSEALLWATSSYGPVSHEASSASFEFFPVLAEGENDVTVTFGDLAGNVSSARYRTTLDTEAPVVLIDSPREGTVSWDGAVRIFGVVTNEQPEWVSVEVVDSGPIEPILSEEGYFVRVDGLDDGEAVIRVHAEDCAGNAGLSTRTVTVRVDNGCGGRQPLEREVGAPCGPCGLDAWECVGPNELRCSGSTTNACGGCGDLDEEPGDRCGPCGLDEWACVHGEMVRCSGATRPIDPALCGRACASSSDCDGHPCSAGLCVPCGAQGACEASLPMLALGTIFESENVDPFEMGTAEWLAFAEAVATGTVAEVRVNRTPALMAGDDIESSPQTVQEWECPGAVQGVLEFDLTAVDFLAGTGASSITVRVPWFFTESWLPSPDLLSPGPMDWRLGDVFSGRIRVGMRLAVPLRAVGPSGTWVMVLPTLMEVRDGVVRAQPQGDDEHGFSPPFDLDGMALADFTAAAVESRTRVVPAHGAPEGTLRAFASPVCFPPETPSGETLPDQ